MRKKIGEIIEGEEDIYFIMDKPTNQILEKECFFLFFKQGVSYKVHKRRGSPASSKSKGGQK